MNQNNLPQSPANKKLTSTQIQDLIGLIPYASLLADDQGRISWLNRLAEDQFGYAADEIIGQPVDILLPERYRGYHAQFREKYMADPRSRPMENRLDLITLHNDGREFPVEIGLRPLVTQDDFFVLVIIHDITKHKQEEEKVRHSQEQMQALSARLLTLREKEQAHISRLVHDEFGQMLSGLKMDLAWLQRRLDPGQEPLLDKTRVMSRLIDDAVQAVRRLATELRPAILDDLGLEAAVEWQLQEFQRRTDISCTWSSNIKENSLDAESTTTAFRILQEALTNVARHAQATLVEVVLTKHKTELTMVVRDNGRGISDDERDHPKSIGILGMRERARILSGRLEIEGLADKGTTITLRLPLMVEEEKSHD